MQLKKRSNLTDIDLISNEVINLHESARSLECYPQYLEIAKKVRESADELSELIKHIKNTCISDKNS
jgi:hypothetical protein